MDPVKDDEEVAALTSQIAALDAAGNYLEAIPLAERYAQIVKARHGEGHPSYAAALTALAVLLLNKANRLAEAEALLRSALAIYEKAPGPNPLDIAKALNSLAQLLNDTGRVAEAEPLRRFALHLEAGGGMLLAGPPDASIDAAERDDAEEQPASAGMQAPTSPAPAQAPTSDRRRAVAAGPGAEPQARTETALPQRAEPPKRREKVDAKGALEIDAGRLAYQIPKRMWIGLQETVEVRLGRRQAQGLMQGFAGRGEVRTEDIPIVETMSVSLLCEPGKFEIVTRSEKDQLVKPDLVLGTPFHSDDFGRWVWLVTPREKGEHTLLVKVSAAVRDSRGLPSTASLPDRTFAVSVRVRLIRAALGALGRAAPGLAWAVVTALVGVFTKDYWWPAIRNMIGMG